MRAQVRLMRVMVMTQTDFKVGDKVRVLVDEAQGANVKAGDIGTIKDIETDGDFWTTMENGEGWFFRPKDVELVALGSITLDELDPTPHCPSHYKQGDIECIDAIYEALGVTGFIDYCRGSIMKYVWRCEDKGDKDHDLNKAERFAQWAASKELYSQGIKPSQIP